MTNFPGVGDAMPDIAMETPEGGHVRPSDFAGSKLVMFFYPKDDTPGCTKEGCNFRDAMPRLVTAGVPVFGASKDGSASHKAFKQKYNLNFPLLVDPAGDLAKRWGVEDGAVARRVTFVINAEGRVAKVWDPVSVAGHVDEVLSAVRSLG